MGCRARQFGLAVAALALLCATPSHAQSPDAITKPVSIYVAGTAGGGIDLYARLLGRHIGRHIEGNPVVDVQDMPGAGGIRAANFLAVTAPKDGTAIATFAGRPADRAADRRAQSRLRHEPVPMARHDQPRCQRLHLLERAVRSTRSRMR